jgi:hypothetical protein
LTCYTKIDHCTVYSAALCTTCDSTHRLSSDW